MPTYTIFADVNDNSINSQDIGAPPSSSAVRAGTGNSIFAIDPVTNVNAAPSYTFGPAGKSGDFYFAREVFQKYDTSSIPSSDTVTAVALSLNATVTSKAGTWTMEAYSKSWTAPLTTADWVNGTAISSLTILASIASGSWSDSTYNTLTENGTNFQTAINKGGTTSIMLGIQAFRTNVNPTGSNFGTFNTADQTGTTQDPKLVVTTTAAVTDTSKMLMMF